MKRRFLFFLLLITVIMTGCMQNDPEPTPEPTPTATIPPEVAPVPKSGGNLRLSMRAPKTLNPLYNEDATVDAVLKLLFEPLAALDQEQKPVSNLVSVNFAHDGLSVLLTLRDGAQWSDGMPIIADDIIFSVETLRRAPDTVLYKDCVDNISNCIKIDNRSVRIHYSQPYGGSAYRLCFPVIPEHYYIGETDITSDKNMQPVGSGLYRFTDYANMKEMSLEINPNTYRKRPYIEKITVIVTPDMESDLYALDQGRIDLVSAQISDWGKYRSTKETNVKEYPTSYYEFIGFNFDSSVLSDKRIRTAIAHSINIDGILDSIYLSRGLRAHTPISPASWVYEPEVTLYGYDLEKSKKILADAGYKLNTDGVMEKLIEEETVQLFFRILVNEENAERVKIADILQDSFEDLGIGVEITVLPFNEYEERLLSRDFDIFIGGFNLSAIPDLTFAFHSSQISTGQNYFAYRDETMDGLLGQVVSATTEIGFEKSLSDLQKHFADQIPCISLVFRKMALISDKNVLGELMPAKNNIFANINEWYMN